MISKRNKISSAGLFCLVYISRIVVSLTALSSATYGKLSADLLVSIVLSLGLTLIMSLPAIYCYKNGKSPFKSGIVGLLYCLFFILMSAINVSRFSYFASTTLNPETKAWMFIIIICVCAWYCCSLGIEALSRFSGFAIILAIIGMIVVISMNVKNYHEINLYPVISNTTDKILKNTVILTCNTTELAFLLCLKERVNGNAVKSFSMGIVSAYLTTFLLVLVVLGVMGDGAKLQEFPVFTLFQVTKISYFERLDVLHISFWIIGIFIKTVLLQYCAVISIKSFNMNKKCSFAAIATFALAMILTKTGFSLHVSPLVVITPFLAFCVAIPLITLIFGKRSEKNEIAQGI